MSELYSVPKLPQAWITELPENLKRYMIYIPSRGYIGTVKDWEYVEPLPGLKQLILVVPGNTFIFNLNGNVNIYVLISSDDMINAQNECALNQNPNMYPRKHVCVTYPEGEYVMRKAGVFYVGPEFVNPYWNKPRHMQIVPDNYLDGTLTLDNGAYDLTPSRDPVTHTIMHHPDGKVTLMLTSGLFVDPKLAGKELSELGDSGTVVFAGSIPEYDKAVEYELHDKVMVDDEVHTISNVDGKLVPILKGAPVLAVELPKVSIEDLDILDSEEKATDIAAEVPVAVELIKGGLYITLADRPEGTEPVAADFKFMSLSMYKETDSDAYKEGQAFIKGKFIKLPTIF